MRVFIGLDIDQSIRERITRFLDGVREFAPDARWVRTEGLHVTLKFLGEQTASTVDAVKAALQQVVLTHFNLAFRGYGFFPTPRAARVFWVGIEAGPELAGLAKKVDESTFALGIPKEDHTYSPHLTLARAGSGAPRQQKSDVANRRFEQLQEKLASLSAPDFGSMTAQEFFLYESQLGRGGSRYSKLARFPLQ